jgi:hypothetical protein
MEELIITLSARLNGRSGFRARAGHSVHDMLCAARLPCACSSCGGLVPPHIPTDTGTTVPPDVSDLDHEPISVGEIGDNPF